MLLGHQKSTCKLVGLGVSFGICLYAATSKTATPHHFFHVTWEFPEDPIVWKLFFTRFNGVSFWCRSLCLQTELQVHSDASEGATLGVF